eukprot:8398037-Alexandrium_andersonii.AAC.1
MVSSQQRICMSAHSERSQAPLPGFLNFQPATNGRCCAGMGGCWWGQSGRGAPVDFSTADRDLSHKRHHAELLHPC